MAVDLIRPHEHTVVLCHIHVPTMGEIAKNREVGEMILLILCQVKVYVSTREQVTSYPVGRTVESIVLS